ncbi:MAG: nucleotidyltransferase domain-containing protein [Campylobacterales bacterium]|nr:nucleotidyltransferase domain-containing protein [Campylobacterales bacterium]
MSNDETKHMQKNILEYLTSQKRTLESEYHINKIGLFGSYARNSEHFGSDIDIVLKFDDSYISSCDPWEYFNILNHIKDDMSKKFMLNVDIVDEQSDSPYLETIKKEAIYV